MCTGPPSKILFIVVKEYVPDPNIYFQDESRDESKKRELKAVLPPEYHAAVYPEAEYRKSVPVMYAILQLSLGAEHQPKSGWGQEVKDTDTGVGDDVERVYQVHTLRREIQDAKKISADGYEKLFEMLIGAAERLNIKGKCSEEYKEIARRWEKIKKKQWVMDKWKTTDSFTNFVKKWS
jgi:hypothetical protein